MPSRHRPKHPYAEIYTQSRWHPALVLCWVHGGSRDPDAWFAEVVIDSPNVWGHSLELQVRAEHIRRVEVVASDVRRT